MALPKPPSNTIPIANTYIAGFDVIRYDGSLESLRNKSRRPKHHPRAHTDEELKLIQDMRRRNPEAGLVVFWVKLRQRGYSRSITGLYRTLKRIGMTPVKQVLTKILLFLSVN